MKPRIPLLARVAGTAFLAMMGWSGIAHSQTLASNSILIKVPSGSSRSTQSLKLQAVKAQVGIIATQTYKHINWEKADLAPGKSVKDAIAQLAKQGIKAEPNAVQHLTKTPNDPNYSSLYGMEKVGAPAAWEITQGGREVGGKDVVVAVIDSGIDVNHPDLKANLWVNSGEIPNNGRDDDGNGFVDDYNGYDFVNRRGNFVDDNGHGTHVSGTIGATGNNGVGVVGMNWNVKLMGCKVGDSTGAVYTSAVLNALDYVIDQKRRGVNIRVTNNSYGGTFPSEAESDAFTQVAAEGILNVCAAGNDGVNNDSDPHYPSSFDIPGLISVAASDQDDQPADFSNFGRESVDIAAPGVGILSTYPGGKYEELDGTSMATPMVAGAAALLLSQVPDLSPEEVKARLMSTVDVLPQWNRKVVSNGRLNIAKALGTNIGSIVGTVKISTGQPLAGARLLIGSKVVYTNATGVYRFTGLKVGTYVVQALANGYTFDKTKATVTINSKTYTATQNFVATPSVSTYTISGVIRDTKGHAISGAQIFLNTSPTFVATSNKDGYYTVPGRIAAKYTVTARLGKLTLLESATNKPSIQITLPTTGTGAPNAKINWLAPIYDTTAPEITVTSPRDNARYVQGEFTAITGRVTDAGTVAEAGFYLYRYTNGQYYFYNWDTKKFEIPDAEVPRKVVAINSVDAGFNVKVPTLAAGYDYGVIVDATDSSNNSSSTYRTFTITSDDTYTNGDKWPYIVFSSPKNGNVIPANTKFGARGSAYAKNGVDSLAFYLQRIDQDGNSLGYYDWVNKTWVNSRTGENTLYRIDALGGTSATWSFSLPPLPEGTYILSGFGRSQDGQMPPADGSQDDSVTFQAASSNTPSSAPSAKGS